MPNGTKHLAHRCLLLPERKSDTYWVGGERPALPRSAHCWLKTKELDRLTPSPGGRWERLRSDKSEEREPPAHHESQLRRHCGSHWERRRLLGFARQVPVAVEDFSQDGVVRFLGHRAFPARVESRQVPPHHLHHALPGLRLLSDAGGNHTNGSLARERA